MLGRVARQLYMGKPNRGNIDISREIGLRLVCLLAIEVLYYSKHTYTV